MNALFLLSRIGENGRTNERKKQSRNEIRCRRKNKEKTHIDEERVMQVCIFLSHVILEN